ncbi:MAG: hypothetical protein JWP12_3869 [Bacteroidetes bacterium]|nr:hypothetical protein [Bacteroidota bacterium]
MSAILNPRKTLLKLFCVIALFTFFSCHKEGTGGKSSVSGTVKHHSAPIPNCIVYIKYGATEFPGTDVSLYDASVTADAAAHYEFKELQKGDYFLYGVGFDPTGPYNVTGGIGIKLKRNQALTSDVPVTE